jgi:phenylalanyl-tRNA synthetase beta chain
LVTVPQHRLDVNIPADLYEEIARIYGYDRIPTTLMNDELPPQRSNRELELEERLRDLLVGAGLQEVITYSLGNLETFNRLLPNGPRPRPEDYIQLANPLTPEREFMRRTLQSHLLETVHDNLRFTERIAIFEVGRVYWPREGEMLPEEPRHLCIAMTGPRGMRSWLEEQDQLMDYFDIKGVMDSMLRGMNLDGVAFAPAAHPTYHPGRSAVLSVAGVEVGQFGEVHPDVAEAYDIEQRVCLGEFNLEKMLATAGEPVQMIPVSSYPAVYEDLAVVVSEQVPAVQVRDLILQTGGKMLRKVELFDVYQGPQVGQGKKSLAYALTYQADDRTLTDAEVAKRRNQIVGRLERELGAVLRS